ncbi:FliH/SctL family protein [Azospirillum sp. SYSU D00513]|uniref:FliH/SctL family protein n=1 Tax=Azospirillum sp. SYSU D00513 TaxID=2812561 RepID=UPI001A962D8F|nr:FliH/SctL family protein [Azospirillum sp. SYSU D00513]
MSSVRKFLFNESFDIDVPTRAVAPEEDDYLPPPAPEPDPEPEPAVPPPPTFSEEELAAARAEAFAEGASSGRSDGYGKGFTDGLQKGQKDGHEKARAEIEATVQARTAKALEQIGAGVASLIAAREADNALRSDQPVHIALAIVRKLMPELALRGGLGEIEAMLRACLTDLVDEPRLVVRVADAMAEPLREHLEQISSLRGFGAKLMVVPDPGVKPGDARIEWADGGMERDTARLLAEVERIAGRLLEAPAP